MENGSLRTNGPACTFNSELGLREARKFPSALHDGPVKIVHRERLCTEGAGQERLLPDIELLYLFLSVCVCSVLATMLMLFFGGP